jgi:hypothetical protein
MLRYLEQKQDQLLKLAAQGHQQHWTIRAFLDLK